MHRLAWIVVACVACGGEKEKPKPTPSVTPDAAVAKVEPPKPDASNERPPDDKAPPPVVKPVEGDCNRRTEDTALVPVCEYRCTSLKEADACAIGAKKYYAGDGIRIDQATGAALVKLACELESADGCTYLARLDTAKADELTAKVTSYLERDCAGDKALGCIDLAERVKAFDEARAKTELRKGLDLAIAGCEGGDGSLCFAASKIFDVAALGIEKDVTKAADLRKRACEAGHATTCVRLAAEADKPDKREALFDKACTFGFRKACAQLASDLASKNTTRAAKMIERACQLGDGDWCVRIGEDLATGNQRDKAIEMFTRACKLGSDHGCSQARALGAK